MQETSSRASGMFQLCLLRVCKSTIILFLAYPKETDATNTSKWKMMGAARQTDWEVCSPLPTFGIDHT
jgi:hypothetical protein